MCRDQPRPVIGLPEHLSRLSTQSRAAPCSAKADQLDAPVAYFDANFVMVGSHGIRWASLQHLHVQHISTSANIALHNAFRYIKLRMDSVLNGERLETHALRPIQN